MTHTEFLITWAIASVIVLLIVFAGLAYIERRNHTEESTCCTISGWVKIDGIWKYLTITYDFDSKHLESPEIKIDNNEVQFNHWVIRRYTLSDEQLKARYWATIDKVPDEEAE